MVESALHMPKLFRTTDRCPHRCSRSAPAHGPRRRRRAGRRRSRAAAPAVVEQSAHDRLFDLFKASDEASLKRNPLNALFRGDLRYADRLGDGISDEYYAAERAAAEADLAALQRDPAGRAQRRPTRSPTTSSNFRPGTRCAGSSRTCSR